MFIKTNDKGFTYQQQNLRNRVITYWMERSEYYLNLSCSYESIDRAKSDMFLEKSHHNRVEAEQVASMNPWQFNLYFEDKNRIAESRSI